MLTTSTSSSNSPSLLLIGLKPSEDLLKHPHPIFTNKDLAKEVDNNLREAQKEMNERGIKMKMLLTTVEEGKGPFINLMKKEKFDALIIGGGIKVYQPCSNYLEFSINFIKDFQPKTKIYFIAGPEQIIPTVRRAAEGKMIE